MRAITDFVKRRQSDDITERLDQVYSEESSEIDPALFQMQVLSLPAKDQ